MTRQRQSREIYLLTLVKIPADNPTLSTISSVSLRDSNQNNDMILSQTNPLQLIRDPIAPASRHWKPAYLAANVHPPNFPAKASTQTETVNAHIVPNKGIYQPTESSATIA
jgi:hypothetical protein